MVRKISNFFIVGSRFRKEFRRQIRSLVIIMLAFTIAFSWRQTLFDLSQTFVQFVTNIKNSAVSTILTSTFITLLAILLIFLTSFFLKEGNNHYD